MTNQTAIITSSAHDNALTFVPAHAIKDDLSRLTLYTRWLAETGQDWTRPDLASYRDYLLTSYTGRNGKPLAAASVQAHLSTIRGRYADLLKNNQVRDNLYQITPADASGADRKAFVDEALTRIANGIDSDLARVVVVKEQDIDDSKHLRLTREQAERLIDAPFTRKANTPLQALRDAAMIAIMLCTGVREMELMNLDVADLRTKFGGELALRVREGKGAKARSIPYGNLDFCLVIIERWLTAAGITEGAIFRGFYKGGRSVRASRITHAAINQILDYYPLIIEGMPTRVNPHDLRRTYARRLYEAGMSILAIQQNMGHADHKTTEGYIGTLDVSARRAPQLYTFDPARLGLLI